MLAGVAAEVLERSFMGVELAQPLIGAGAVEVAAGVAQCGSLRRAGSGVPAPTSA